MDGKNPSRIPRRGLGDWRTVTYCMARPLSKRPYVCGCVPLGNCKCIEFRIRKVLSFVDIFVEALGICKYAGLASKKSFP